MLSCNLIFEGIGHSGKTTLINSVSELVLNTKIHTYKMPIPFSADSGVEQYKVYYNMLVNNTDSVTIFDRGHTSEMVYAPIYRNYYSNKYHQFLKDIDYAIAGNCSVPTYIVYLYTSWQSIMEPCSRITDDLIAIPRQYDHVLRYTNISTIRIGTQFPNKPQWRSQDALVKELLNCCVL